MITDEPNHDVKNEESGKQKPRKATTARGSEKPPRGAGGGSIRRFRAVLMILLAFGLGGVLDHFFLHPNSMRGACQTAVLLATGSSIGDFTLFDDDDTPFALSTLIAGRVALIVFEDKDSGGQNEAFKKRFGVLRDSLGDRVVLLPVADVSNYNYWPAKRFVKSALREAGSKDGITVYADWSGAGRTLLRPRPTLSNLVLVDRSLKVLWASSGQLTKSQEDELIELLRSAAR